MEKIGLLLISILPIIIIAYYVYSKDFDKEPTHLLIKLLIGGVLSVIPAVFIEFLVDDIFPSVDFMTKAQFAVYIFVDIAFVEEVFKWFIVYIFSFNSKDFDYVYDGVVYACFTSLGFAAVENVLYVTGSGNIGTGLLRAFISVPAHACFGIIMGILLAKAKKEFIKRNDLISAIALFLSITLPSFLHALFDYLLCSNGKTSGQIFVIYVIILFVFCFTKLTKIAKERKKIYLTRTLKLNAIKKS